MPLRHLLCLAFLTALTFSPAQGRPLEPELANCLVWQIDKSYVHGQTFQYIGEFEPGASGILAVTEGSGPMFLREKWRNPTANYLPTFTCVITGSRYSLVAPRLREYLAAEVKAAILTSVRVEMADFLRAIREANTEERRRMIDRLINELPNDQALIQALKAAIAQQ